jgi:hypothetical protein
MASVKFELVLADDFRTIDWLKAYPHPKLGLFEIERLLIYKKTEKLHGVEA